MFDFDEFVTRVKAAAAGDDAQPAVEALMREAVAEPEAMEQALAGYRGKTQLEDLAFHRSDTLTLLAATLPPGFVAGPHNHNLWAVIGVYGGQENNHFFERKDGGGLEPAGDRQVMAPDVLCLPVDVIHSISNPLDRPLSALHAYGGDLLATPRSSWDPETGEEIAYDWQKVARR